MAMKLSPRHSVPHHRAAPARDINALHPGFGHHQFRETPHTRAISRIGKWRGIRRRHRIGNIRHIAPKQSFDIVIGIVAVEIAPCVKPVAAAPAQTQHRIHHQKAIEPRGHVLRNGQTQKPAPVLNHQRDVFQIQPFDQGDQALTVKGESVTLILHRLSDRPNPNRSGTTTRAPVSRKTGIMWR